VETLPAGLDRLPWFTPLYHAVEIIRPLLHGNVSPRLLTHLCWLTAFVVLTIRLPLVMVRNRLVQ